MSLLVFILLMVTILSIAYATRQSQLREALENENEIEREIVRAAMRRSGRVTALDVQTRRAYPIELIEERLRAMHRQGYCDSVVGDGGSHTYVFRDFDDAPQRAAAIEKQILRIAETHSGIVTVRGVTLSTDLSYVEARTWLDEMCGNRILFPTDEPDVYTFTPPRELSDASESSIAQPRRLRE